MLKKLKYFILGAIVATFINFGISFAGEEYFQLKRVDYPIFVNGVETNLESLIFNYEGSTYIPLRKVANVTGAEVIWNNNLKSVIITIKPKETIKEVIKEVPVEKLVYVTPPPTPIPTPPNPITTVKLQSDKYEGTIINSKFEGFGKYTWSNGDFYIGEFKNGKFNGKGTVCSADGSISVGNYSDGNENGYSVFVFSDGAVKGYYLDGKLTNKQAAIFGSVINETQNTNNVTPSPNVPTTQSTDIAMYMLLKDRLDKQLAADIQTAENICAFKIKTMKETLNARGIIDSTTTQDHENSYIAEKEEAIKNLNEKYKSDLAILKNLYGIN